MKYIDYFLKEAVGWEKGFNYVRDKVGEVEYRALLYWQAADFAAITIRDTEPDNKALIERADREVCRLFGVWESISYRRGVR